MWIIEKALHTRHILGEKLRSDARVPKSTLRFGARFSSQTALKHKNLATAKGMRGDTLVEVLVCIAIVSMILAGAFVVTGRSRQGVQNSQEHAKAMKLLESQLEQLRASAENASPGSPSSIFTYAGDFCMSSGSLQSTSSASCNIGSAEPVYHLSVTRTGNASSGYVFTASARWAAITNGYSTEQLSYRLYENN